MASLVSHALDFFVGIKMEHTLSNISDVDRSIIILQKANLLKGGKRFERSLTKVKQAVESAGANPYDIMEEMRKDES